MKNSNTGFLVGVVAVIALLLVGGWALTHGTSAAPASGNVINTSDYYPAGIHFGNQSVISTVAQGITNAAAIQIQPGQNQASWLNTSPTTAYVCEAFAFLTGGTASSTVKLNMGTSTTATKTDVFSNTTSPLWAQMMDAASIATGTPSGLVVADNGNNHKTGYSSCMGVPTGQYLVATISTYCTADAACNTATSSARGFSTLTIPFNYVK